MKRTYIKDLQLEQETTIAGWVDTIRDQKTMMFIIFKDVSGSVQITIQKAQQQALVKKLSDVTKHSFLRFKGKAVRTS